MSRSSKPFEVRVRENGRNRSVFLFANSGKQASKKVRGGTILSVRKVPIEKILGIGEYMPRIIGVEEKMFQLDREKFLGKR